MSTVIGTLRAEAVIFDFDGVIVDTEPLHYRAFQKILEPLGLGYGWDDYLETYIGYDDRDAFRAAFTAAGRTLAPEQLVHLVTTKADIFQEVIRDGVTSYPGVVQLVRRIKTSGIPLAICSGALRSDILPILELLAIGECFDVIVTADDVARSKPDPASYRHAFERLKREGHINGTPSGALAIEDTPAGIASAKGAGLTVLAVTNSYPCQELRSADYIIDSLELLEISAV